MVSSPRTARFALGATVLALLAAVGGGALFTGASADTTRDLIRVSFRPASARGIAGWRTDNGAAFDGRRAYGWVRDDDTNRPVSMAGHAVSTTRRAGLADTYVAMQPPKANWGRWQLTVAPGTYRVTVTFGDASGAKGSQSLAVEGTEAVRGFTPSAHHRTADRTVEVAVTDGHLTVDPLFPNRSARAKLVSIEVRTVLGDDPTTTTPVTTTPVTTTPATTTPATTTPTTPPSTTPPTTPPSGGRDQMGFAGGGLFLSSSDADIKREMDGMKATGATWLRIGFSWTALEPKTQGTYSFTRLDQVVGWANERGLRLLANVSYTPVWDRPAGCSSMMCPPADVDDYARFMGALVRHYSPLGVKDYEVWNEANMNSFWQPKPNPAVYGEMLREAYVQAHQADPNVTVVAGAFAPARDTESGSTQNPRTFMAHMYEAGVAGHFDALSFHPYSGNVDPATQAHWNMMTSVGPDLVAMMAAHGDGGKKIWGTEMAYSTGTNPKSVTQTQQVTLLREAIETWRQQSYAGPLFFFTYRDIGTDPKVMGDNYGLVKRDFTPKLALGAMRDFLHS